MMHARDLVEQVVAAAKEEQLRWVLKGCLSLISFLGIRWEWNNTHGLGDVDQAAGSNTSPNLNEEAAAAAVVRSLGKLDTAGHASSPSMANACNSGGEHVTDLLTQLLSNINLASGVVASAYFGARNGSKLLAA